MSGTTQRPLILVADDDPEYREDIIPNRLREEFNAQILTADTVDAAVEVARANQGALDIIILDMHMPRNVQNIHVLRDGGICFLRDWGFARNEIPVVVFTAYWSFQDCVVAMLAGAATYIPKQSVPTGDHHEEGGINDLVKSCRELLGKTVAA